MISYVFFYGPDQKSSVCIFVDKSCHDIFSVALETFRCNRTGRGRKTSMRIRIQLGTKYDLIPGFLFCKWSQEDS